jgi:sugar lactone lactonase YvrE
MKKTLILALLLIGAAGSAQQNGSPREALKQVKSGWVQQLLYEQVLVSPIALCYAGDNNLYVYEHSRNMLYRVGSGGALTAVTSTGDVNILAMTWQPGRERLVGFDVQAMYHLYPGGFRKIRDLDPSFMVSTVSVNPGNDSIFVGHEEPGGSIAHLDAEGRLIAILKRGVQGCSQMAYDARGEVLYYSETFAGTISALYPRSRKTEVIVENIGIPGTVEPIVIWLDNNNALWYFTVADGMYRYESGGFQEMAPPMMGAGPIVWSPATDNWISIEYAGANLVTFDYSLNERVDLTPYLNANDIVEDLSGQVFFPRYEFIYKVAGGELSLYAGPLVDVCACVEVDSLGRLYAALHNGDIYRITPSGKTELWKSSLGRTAALAYDAFSDAIVFAARRGDQLAIYRIPVSDPHRVKSVAALKELEGQSLKRLATDQNGGIYLFDWGQNAILKADEKTGRLKTLHADILPSPDISIPGFDYSRIEDAFIIGTLEYYYAIDRTTGQRETLAMNKHGADNFAIHENPDGSLLFIHSGQIFKLRRR